MVSPWPEPQAVPGSRRWQVEPGRVEHVEVVGEDRGVIASLQRVVGEKHVERPTLIQRMDVGNDALERHFVAVVAIHAVQAGGSAGDVVRLLLDDEAEARRRRSRSAPLALVLGLTAPPYPAIVADGRRAAGRSFGYSFVSKSSWP